MLDEENCFKAVNFDLDTKALQQYYPSSNWRKAYEDINKFFLSNDFEHRQGSGYISKQKIKKTTVASKIKTLSRQMPWLSKCVKQFDITNIGTQYSVLDLITNVIPQAESIELSGKSEYISQLDDIERTADKIEAAFEDGKIDLDRDEYSVGGNVR